MMPLSVADAVEFDAFAKAFAKPSQVGGKQRSGSAGRSSCVLPTTQPTIVQQMHTQPSSQPQGCLQHQTAGDASDVG
jgi:hypothetical protein